jgi:alpha-L-fucosidase
MQIHIRRFFLSRVLPAAVALALGVGLFVSSGAAADNDEPDYQIWKKEFGPTHNERMEWWRAARFGMFIHWGVYSVPAGTYKGQQSPHIGEWLMRDYNIPVTEYAEYAKQFDPTNFNAEQWVKLAKNAGMKYIIITAKHHDGFAMFHTRVDGYNIYDATPWHRDPLAELADACRKEGIKLGFYYSEAQDWHHPGGAAADRNSDRNIDAEHHWDAAQKGSVDDYIANVAVPQVKELLNNYGPGVPAVLWFDTPVSMTPERVEQFFPLLQSHPQVIINNRLDSHHHIGDYQTPEQRIPASGLDGDWETCMTINTTWGYKSFDHNWKSAETLIHNLVDIASKGGNYLLNVGPTSAGVIPQPEVKRLRQIGAWMKVNGKSIYGTSASPFGHPFAWGRCTEKTTPEGTTLYLNVFEWPANGKLLVPGLKNEITKAYLLKKNFIGWHKHLATENNSDGVTISLPQTAPDKISSTIVLKLQGKPDIQ